MLDSQIRSRVEERAGRIQAWWATTQADGRVKAVAFGSLGLCVAEPTTRPNGTRSYSVSTYVIDPATVRRKNIDHRPGARASGTPPPAASSTSMSPADEHLPYGAPPSTSLSGREREVLGNLPPLVQQLLQEPFVRGEQILRADWHYEGNATAMDAVTFILAGPRTVTVAAGRMHIPPGHSLATAHWSLACYRADVVRRIGR
ncbi:hypothetical protein [Frankia sp. Mgl5]|uniref:hypothetical protein n=1 Tax=Frankia sp. Mgl5 TaxID=2933793 RepID=UPI00200EAE4D|nr:hypothetical protein [Frankia sp. Mgl5]